MYQIGYSQDSGARRALYMVSTFSRRDHADIQNLNRWGPDGAGEIFKVSYRYFTFGHSWVSDVVTTLTEWQN